MLMALYLTAVLCQTSITGLRVHLQRQRMNMISKVPMVYMGLFFLVEFGLLFPFTEVLCTDFVLFAQHIHEVGYLESERLLNFNMKTTYSG